MLNLNNIEEFLFEDQKIRKILPEFINLFDQWKLAKITPALRSLGKRSVLELMNSLNEEHLSKLSNYFSTKVTIDKIDYRIVKNYTWDESQVEQELSKINSFGNYAIHKEGNNISITFWR